MSYTLPMSNTASAKYGKRTFVLRVDDEFIGALDKIRAQDKPALSRADMIRRLVFQAERLHEDAKKPAASGGGPTG
jgi:hypothetical protein